MTILFLSIAIINYIASFIYMIDGLTRMEYKKDIYIKALGICNLITIILFIMCVWIGEVNV